MTVKQPDEVRPDVRAKVAEVIDRLRNPVSKELMWNRALTERDREWADKHITQKEWNKKDAIELYSKIRVVDDIVAVLDLGVSCGHLERDLYDSLRGDIGIDVVEHHVDVRRAMAEVDLVVDEFRRLVIWRQSEVPCDLYSDEAVWQYFFKLIRAGASGRSICSRDFSSTVQPKQLNHWKYRLTKPDDFPVNLADKIVCRNGRHGLDLSPNQIRVFPIHQPVPLA